jgi:hypothetical protein
MAEHQAVTRLNHGPDDSMTQLEAVEWLVGEVLDGAGEVDTVSYAEPSIALTLPNGQAATLRLDILPD